MPGAFQGGVSAAAQAVLAGWICGILLAGA
jgi:hypothetical protein